MLTAQYEISRTEFCRVSELGGGQCVKQRSSHQSRGKCPGGNVLDPIITHLLRATNDQAPINGGDQ